MGLFRRVIRRLQAELHRGLSEERREAVRWAVRVVEEEREHQVRLGRARDLRRRRRGDRPRER